MSKVHKIWYLKIHLVGEAAKLIQHFSATEENFDGAWAMLVDRYNNRRLLVSKLIHELVETPGNASSDNFKKLHDRTQECLLALKNLSIITSFWDPFLLHLLLKNRILQHVYGMGSVCHAQERCQKSKKFLEFLERHFQTFEAMGAEDKFPHSKSNLCTSVT